MSKKDMGELRSSMKDVTLKKEKVRRSSFTRIVRSRNNSFMDAQIQQAFEMVDKDHSGTIDRDEFEKWIGNGGANRLAELAKNIQAVEDVEAVIQTEGSTAVKNMWRASMHTLAALEKMIKDIRKDLNKIRIKLRSFHVDIPWPFESFDLKLEEIQFLLQKLLRAYIEHMDEAEHLLHLLDTWFRELKILLHDLGHCDVSLPNLSVPGWDDFAEATKKAIGGIQETIQNALHLHLDKLLTIAWPHVFKKVFRPPKLQLGEWFMKLKIFIGFAQCFCYFPVTFDIPWPENLLWFMEFMEFDFMSLFGDLSCRMQTGFFQKFLYHMAVFPCMMVVIGAIWTLVKHNRLAHRCKAWRPRYNNDSVRIQAYTLTSLITFTLYTGIASRIFRLFKCQRVEATLYLTADYSIKCWEGDWNGYAAIAFICIIMYVIGLPAMQGYILWKFRDNLHKRSCKDPKLQRQVEKEFGSIYAHYTDDAFYFELVDLARRLLLTGGLILMGEESVGQIFFGILVCALWLVALVGVRPYKSEWDNVVAIALAGQLLLTIVAGMALKLYAATPGQDEDERRSFGVVLIIASVLCVLLSIGTLLASLPWVQKKVNTLRRRCRTESSPAPKETPSMQVDNPMHAKITIEMTTPSNAAAIRREATLPNQTKVAKNVSKNVNRLRRLSKLQNQLDEKSPIPVDTSLRRQSKLERLRRLSNHQGHTRTGSSEPNQEKEMPTQARVENSFGDETMDRFRRRSDLYQQRAAPNFHTRGSRKKVQNKAQSGNGRHSGREFRELFNLIDTDRSNTIDIVEFVTFLQKYAEFDERSNLSESRIESIFRSTGKDEIDYTEFASLCQALGISSDVKHHHFNSPKKSGSRKTPGSVGFA
jgi:Ca2+-binding EF-hand superfamily protein